ncbi:MAG: YihY/virulence factor BrkB family protein [Deltaproteobacteria bacterium]|nr:YihY/virulence factor BrkB family protein [Deltaproteobacteria bacterium]
MADIYEITKKAVLRWLNDDCPRMGATLSYYVVFSIAPLILLSISIGGLVFEKSAVQAEIIGQLRELFGEHSIGAIEMLLEVSYKPTAGLISTCVGILALLIGASCVVIELQSAINKIWRIEEKKQGWWVLVKKRLLSMGMVLGTGFLLLVSLVISAVLSATGKFMSGLLPLPEGTMHFMSMLFSFIIITGLFALIYKVLPATHFAWRHVWPGATITAFLFTVGKFLIGLYLGKESIGSSYGAAGSFIVFLLWVYYSAQIFYLGAEFTKVLADRSTKPHVLHQP